MKLKKRICKNCEQPFYKREQTNKEFCVLSCYWEYLRRGHNSEYNPHGYQVNHRGLKNQTNGMWKGNNVGYYALHSWIKRRLGNVKNCAHCGTTEAKKFEWANISKKYKRNLSDWIRLCTSCHRRYDKHAIKAWETRRSTCV